MSSLCGPMDCSTPRFPIHHQLRELAQTYVHWIGDTIQLSHPMSSPSPPAFNIFQHQGLFQRVGLFTSGGQGIGASASVLPVTIQGLFSLELTGLISLLSKRLSRVFSHTTAWKHQFFSTQPSSWFNSHICTWLLEKPSLWLDRPLLAKWFNCFLIYCLGLSWLSFQGASIF